MQLGTNLGMAPEDKELLMHNYAFIPREMHTVCQHIIDQGAIGTGISQLLSTGSESYFCSKFPDFKVMWDAGWHHVLQALGYVDVSLPRLQARPFAALVCSKP